MEYSTTTNTPSYVTPAMSRRHPASLVPKFMHDPALLELVRAPVTAEMIGTLSSPSSLCSLAQSLISFLRCYLLAFSLHC